MDNTLICIARTAAYVAVWNDSSKAVPTAMKAVHEAVGIMREWPGSARSTAGDDLLRAAVWDAIWTVTEADHFRIVNNISGDACADMAIFNAQEYIGCPGMLYAMARAAAWRRVIDVRTYDAWVKAYELCLQQAREAFSWKAFSPGETAEPWKTFSFGEIAKLAREE